MAIIVILHIEIIRRANLSVLLEWQAYQATREVIYSQNPEHSFKGKCKEMARRTQGIWGLDTVIKPKFQVYSYNDAIEVRVKVRYPQFMRIRLEANTKHHLEITEKWSVRY